MISPEIQGTAPFCLRDFAFLETELHPLVWGRATWGAFFISTERPTNYPFGDLFGFVAPGSLLSNRLFRPLLFGDALRVFCEQAFSPLAFRKSWRGNGATGKTDSEKYAPTKSGGATRETQKARGKVIIAKTINVRV